MKQILFFLILNLSGLCAAAQTAGLSITSDAKFYLDLQSQPVNDEPIFNIYLLGLPNSVSVRLRVFDGTNYATIDQKLSLENGRVMHYEIVSRAGLAPTLRFLKYGNAPVFTGGTTNTGYGGLDPASFAILLQKLEDEPFDQKRVETAASAVQYSQLSSAQVRDIAEIFDHEIYRLEFAKHAWHHVYDRGMFLLVFDAFDFSTYISELKQYMKDNP